LFKKHLKKNSKIQEFEQFLLNRRKKYAILFTEKQKIFGW